MVEQVQPTLSVHDSSNGSSTGNGSSPHLRPVKLTDNARTVLEKRYLRRGKDGKPAETIEEMFWRVAHHIAMPDGEHGGDVAQTTEQFYDLLTSLRFFPNSPTFTGAGTPLGQLAACFVLPIDDDMGRGESGIFQTLRDAALIQQTGGGNGFSFSRLRPKGDHVKTSAGSATGPVGFLRVYDKAFGEIAQGGTRRGANMGVLRVDHPDIEEFITCKVDENQITNFNISVALTDAFMQAVEADGDFNLVNPHDGRVWRTVRARDLFAKIVRYAHHNGEPGALFIDAANRTNPVPQLYELEATNPCGEQWLGPYENCCLGSINLAEHVTEEGLVDWTKLEESTMLSTRFLDNVVDANAYVPAVPHLQVAAHRVRRIGLGIMGLGDMMYHLGVRYGSEEGQEFASQVMEFVRYHCMRTSVELARTRGAFPAIHGSIYDPTDFKWTVPQPLVAHTRDWGRPAVDWAALERDLRAYGIRNGAQTTVAPTGTIATVAGCEGYGCEPVFALAYVRHVNDRGQDLVLKYLSPQFERALVNGGVDDDTRTRIMDQALAHGSCQDIAEVPERVRHAFVVSSDISAEEHVRMQAALQAFVDNSLSKTCNFPEGATEADVAQAYLQAWKLGCKGLTVYVTGSREKVVLETHATKAKKEKTELEAVVPVAAEPLSGMQTPAPLPVSKKPRPRMLPGHTYRIVTPLGTAYITINENGGGEPFEVFMNVGKAGSDTAAVAEALGRLISLTLRLPSPQPPQQRLRQVVHQLGGIGGGRSMGFGAARVRSLPDGVAMALSEYLSTDPAANGEGSDGVPLDVPETVAQPEAMQLSLKLGDLCPECGQASVINEEGCRKCYTLGCGYSEC
jgi:ribonucleoside-diphosphate reductase alpha chain